jgi:serine/threonine-protein kinase
MSLGTPHYMAPEQAMGEREITPKADIYALGCVLYEMLTAEPPFVGATAQAIIARVMTEEPRSLTLQRKTIPPHVEAAVVTALAKLPADRFATAAAFAEALGNPAYGRPEAGRGGSAFAGSMTRPSPVRRAVAMLPWVIASVAALALAVATLSRGRGVASSGPIRFYHAPDSGHSISSACCGPPVAISPDGRTIAYEGQAMRLQIWVRDLDQLAARPLQGTEGARNLFFSPDGQWIGYTSALTNRLLKVQVSGGAPITVADVGTLVLGAAWTRDDRIVFARLDSAGLWVVPADGGRPTRLTTPDSADNQRTHIWPHYVTEADAILFAANAGTISLAGARVGMLRLDKGEVRIVSSGAMPQYAAGHLLTVREGGALVAQRFDPVSGDTSGPLVRLADGVITRAGAMAEYAVSAGGTLAYPLGSASAVMSLIEVNGTESRLPVHLPQVSHFDGPQFSPDGRRLLFAGFHDQENRHVGYIFDLERGSSLRLTFGGNTEYLAWSPDGRMVYYRKGDSLAARRSDRGGDETILLRPAEGRRPNGRVSAGREWLAFSVAGEGGTDIWAMRIAAGADSARPYLSTPFAETAPTLSPDGRLLAFVSNETGRAEVYVASFPDAGARASVSIEGGSEPQWARDGRTLYYREEAGDLVAARVLAGPSGVTVESRRTVVRGTYERSPDGAEYDVNPRGNRVVAFGSSGGSGRLVVAVNAVPRP